MINLIEDLPMTAEMNVATAQNQPKTIVPETTVLETTALETTALETTASETIVSEAIISEIPLEAEATATATEGTALNISYTSFDNTLFYHLLIFIYLGGLFVTISVLLIQKYQYTKRLKNALLIEHNETINTLLREINMGQILVFTNDEIASPLVCGLFAPKNLSANTYGF